MKGLMRPLAIAAVIIFLLFFNVTQVHTKPGAPPLGGVSGDPSRSTCAFIGCHPSPELSLNPGDLDINMGTTQGNLSPMAGQSYVPGQTYYIEFKPNVTNGSTTRYGFQTTSLDASANMAGTFTITDPINNSVQSLLNRNYIGHKDASAFHDWNFQWTAPATDIGKVTFYYALDDANGNGSTSGDKIYKGTTDLLPPSSGLDEKSKSTNEIIVYPNPVSDHFSIAVETNHQMPIQFSLYSIEGRQIKLEQAEDFQNGELMMNLRFVNKPVPGIYFLQLKFEAKLVSKKITII